MLPVSTNAVRWQPIAVALQANSAADSLTSRSWPAVVQVGAGHGVRQGVGGRVEAGTIDQQETASVVMGADAVGRAVGCRWEKDETETPSKCLAAPLRQGAESKQMSLIRRAMLYRVVLWERSPPSAVLGTWGS